MQICNPISYKCELLNAGTCAHNISDANAFSNLFLTVLVIGQAIGKCLPCCDGDIVCVYM